MVQPAGNRVAETIWPSSPGLLQPIQPNFDPADTGEKSNGSVGADGPDDRGSNGVATRHPLLAGHSASTARWPFASCRRRQSFEESSPVPVVALPAVFFPCCRLFSAKHTKYRWVINIFIPMTNQRRGSIPFARGWRRVEKEVKKVVKKLKRVVVLVGQRRIFSSFVIFVLSLLIREDSKFKQFRDKGIDPELESKMDELFGGHVARGDDIIIPNMDPLPTPMEENENMVYIPSQPHGENNVNQPFNIKNNDISILGPGVSAWQELWHDDSPISTPPPISQGVDGGRNGKGKRKLENLSVDPNKSAKTNGPKRMRSAAMMYEKLDAILEVIISKKKAREVEREERREKRQRKEMNNKNASGDDGAPSVPDALAKICALPHFDPLHLVYMFACELMEDPQKRTILFDLPNDDSRAQRPTYLYDKYGKK
ncbi:hypothetical protein Cgig2_021547 [Carnegiea gigantea]|uniref:Uncharacterized protein n=1 Tax=Carnegiea gigantea TaxID=171969 RepID=A0A9Q1GG96_9CARY|nr:hypothetical protein Cgig2_021547 [Carnegiea gigantea]